MNVEPRFALTLFLSVLLGACGGGGGSASVSPPPSMQAPSLALFAGGVGGSGYFDGVGGTAKFRLPLGLAVDAAGNVYVADAGNGVIRKIAPSGATSTFAGAAGQHGFVDGIGAQARFGIGVGGNYGPSDVAIDAAGNLYVADNLNHSIRKISPAGVVTTLAGDGTSGSTDGKGNAARFNMPGAVAVDGAMNVYVADTGNHTLRRIAPDGTVTTLAGVPGVVGYIDGPAALARFTQPFRIAADPFGNLYVASDGAIRKRSPDGTVNTLVPPPPASAGADAAADSQYLRVMGLATDTAGNLYATDALNGSVRRISSEGAVTTHAGRKGFNCPRVGAADVARFWSPGALAIAASGAMFVVEQQPAAVRAISPAREVSTLAGEEASCAPADGPIASANIGSVSDVVADMAGTVYVAEPAARVVRRIADGMVSTLPSLYHSISSLALGPSGTIFAMGAQYPGICRFGCVWKPFAHLVRITPAGAAVLLSSSLDGSGPELGAAGGLTADASGALYWSDSHYNVIRKLGASGDVTVLAGSAGIAGHADGAGVAARFNSPRGVVIDGAGTLYVADAANHVIRAVTAHGVVTTIAGTAGVAGSVDGPANLARFNYPAAVARNGNGDLYIADSVSCVVRKIALSGTVSTVAGIPGQCGFTPGPLPGTLDGVTGLAIVGSDLYIGMNHGIAVVHNRP